MVRIIGIAPIMEDFDASGNYRGDMTMYWIPYASLRDMLATHEVFNAQNDSQHYSWEDLFEMRRFESYIYKESNVYDRNIQEYASGVDAQLESDRIKQEIFEKEHDVWEYWILFSRSYQFQSFSVVTGLKFQYINAVL